MRANIIRGSSQTEPNHKGTTIETKKYTEKRVEKYVFTHVDNKIVG